MESVEASGKSIEDAILQALARLGRNRDEVEITVLQEPSRGTRGMGAREARVRVHVLPQRAGYGVGGGAARELPGGYPLEDDGAYDAEPYVDDGGYPEDGEGYFPPDVSDRFSPSPDILVDALREVLPEDASIEEVAATALETILAHMGIQAEVVAADTPEDQPLLLNIQPLGNYVLGTLIGRRGETLAALQLLVNLITYKQTGEHERIVVDVEGYRGRRRRIPLDGRAHRGAGAWLWPPGDVGSDASQRAPHRPHGARGL